MSTVRGSSRLSGILIPAILLSLAAFPLYSQTYNLGNPSDPCTGGAIDSYASFTPPPPAPFTTVRYDGIRDASGNLLGFSCVFPATGGPGVYNATFGWVEAKVTAPGARLFDMTINGYAELQNFDVFASGGTVTNSIWKSFIVNSNDGNITVRMKTEARSATLFTVQITPVAQKLHQDLFTVDCGTPAKPAPNCPSPVCTLVQNNCPGGIPATSFTSTHPINCILQVKRNGLVLYGARDYQLVGTSTSPSVLTILDIGMVSGDIVEMDYKSTQ